METFEEINEMFARFYADGWECEFDDPSGVWISSEGVRLEPDHPDSPLCKLGLI